MHLNQSDLPQRSIVVGELPHHLCAATHDNNDASELMLPNILEQLVVAASVLLEEQTQVQQRLLEQAGPGGGGTTAEIPQPAW